jgi:hypothetical protein
MSESDSGQTPETKRRFWTKRRIGVVLILIGVGPALAHGLYSTADYYLFTDLADRGPEEARRRLIATWDLGKYLWAFLPIGMVVHLLGVMEEATPKKRY